MVRTGKPLNVSRRGVLLRVRERIADHTPVVVQMMLVDERIVLLGRVTHCTETVGGFKIGIELRFAD